MNLLRRHPYLIALAALLVVLPVPVFAVGEDLVFGLVTSVLGLFLRLAAMLLNFSINYFVIDFGGVYAKTGVGYAVDTTWIIIRDFVNMGFIFGFVYIGFKMILNSNDSNTRRWLVNLLLAALLVNFSLFATKFVVDFSNQFAAQIVVNGLGGEYTTNKTTGLAEVDLGQSFMDRMGITSIWENPPTGVGWGYIFGSAILFMITTFVFAAGGMLLIIRFAVLNLFLVLSPLMFLSWVIPGLKDTMNRYWSGFLGRAFFAPIYLLFIYFSLQLISGLQVAVGSGASNLANPSWAGTFQAVGNAGARDIQSSTLGTLPLFVLICVFMIASLVIAQKMGADGGDRAVAIGKQLRNKVQRGVTNTGKFAAAQTGGRAARYGSYKAGEALSSGLRRAQQMQGDGAVAKATRWAARTNAVQETVSGSAKSLKDAKFGLSRTVSEDKKMRYQTKQRADDGMTLEAGLLAQKEKELKEEGKGYVMRGNGAREEVFADELTAAERAHYDDDDARNKKIEAMQRVAADMSIKDFEALSGAQQEAIAQFLSGSQTDSVMKSENISDAQKGKITAAQQKAIGKIIKQNDLILSEKLADLSIRQIETLGDEFITDNAALFTDSQFSDIKKSKKFTEGQIGRFIGKRKADLEKMVAENPASVFNLGTGVSAKTDLATRTTTNSVDYTKSKKVSEIAKLPGTVLAAKGSAKYLSVDALKAIANGDKDFEKVSTSQRDAIKANLEAIRIDGTATPEQKSSAKKALAYLNTAKGQESFFGQEAKIQTPPPAPAAEAATEPESTIIIPPSVGNGPRP